MLYYRIRLDADGKLFSVSELTSEELTMVELRFQSFAAAKQKNVASVEDLPAQVKARMTQLRILCPDGGASAELGGHRFTPDQNDGYEIFRISIPDEAEEVSNGHESA